MVTLMRFNIFIIFVLIYGYIFYRCKKIKSKKMLKEYLNLSIILSILLIFSMTILPISTSYTDVFNLRLIPFGTTWDMFKSGNLLEFCVNIFGNIIMFIPLGFFTYIRSDGDFKTAFLICLMATVSVEIIQMVFPGRCTDIDDIMLNSLGGYIGIRLAQNFIGVLNNSR